MLERISQSDLDSMSAAQRKEKFIAMAEAYMKETGCRWSEACLSIKQRYPAAREVWGAPPKQPA
jgi:hypothetical protein